MDITQELILQVPGDFQVPHFFHTLQPSDIARVITLGTIAYETIKQEGNKSEHEAIFDSLKTEAEKKYSVQIKVLENDYTSQVEELEKQKQFLNTLVSTLKQKIQSEETMRLDTERRVREEERRNREELVKEKDSRINSLESQVRSSLQSVEQSMKESSRFLTDGFQNFKEQILKNTTGSQKKGTQGEVVFEDYLHRVFGSVGIKEEFSLINVGAEGHQGDIRMKWKNHSLLWEVKNYARNIDQKEVNKFLRDMEENPDISLGVMVSLNTNITGHQKTGNIDLEELRDGRICIYVNCFLKNEDPTTFLQSLKPFIETFLQYRKPVSMEESNEAQNQVERLEFQRTVVLRLLKNHQESTRKFKNVIANAKKKNDQLWGELTTEMREAENQVKLLLETILDSSMLSSDTYEEEVEVKLPEYLFRHTDINMYNDKERKFLMDTLKIFKFSEDYSINSKAVKDIYKEHGYSDHTIDNIRYRIFTDDAWEKGKTVVKYMKKIE